MKRQLIIEDVPSIEQAIAHAKKYLAQHHPQSTILSIGPVAPDDGPAEPSATASPG
jgi:hypothetical protein